MSEFRRHLMKAVSGGSPVPPSSQIWYTTSDNSQITWANIGGLSITDQTFDGTKWIVTLSGTVTNLQNKFAYQNQLITSVTLPSSVTTVGVNAFYDCDSLVTVNLPDSVTTIGQFALQNCANLVMTKLPSSLTAIPWFTFQASPKIAIAEIPSGVTSIGQSAFSSTATNNVKILNTTAMITSASSMFPRSSTIQVPSALLADYQADTYWSAYNLVAY